MSSVKATQADRSVVVSTPLGPDRLLFRRMRGTESLSRPFDYELLLYSEDASIDPNKVLGAGVTVAVDLPAGGTRYFNGCASAFELAGVTAHYAVYRATLRPWLWLLTRTANCRIFQHKSVPEILKELFGGHGFSDYELSLARTYKKRDYCVQYRESDFDFASRLMEDEGIYYHFRHEDGKHVLVLCDASTQHAPAPGYAEIPYFPPDALERRERDHIKDWVVRSEIQPGAYVLGDFDFKRPGADLQARTKVERPHAHASFEVFDYPGGYVREEASDEDRNHFVQTRLQELQAQHARASGTAAARGLATGTLFQLVDYPRADQNREYLVVSTEHELEQDPYRSGDGDEGLSHVCHFTAMASQQDFRPARVTPAPIVHGPQTAIVVGREREEIDTDKYGRVKVQFHWDRDGERDENSSCWVRVAQAWAGKGWGALHIPRVGQEVVVEFLEGDPDRPIITGRVYNAEQMPPYTLPGDKTRSGIRSRSTTKGDAKSFNELRFDDRKGAEEIYLHAQRDFTRVVENNDHCKIGFDTKEEGNQTLEVYNSQTVSVGARGCDEGSQTVKIKKDRKVTLAEGNDELIVTRGNRRVKTSAGKQELEAMKSITLKVGQNSIVIDQSGITIKGIKIAVKGDAKADVTSLMTTVAGTGVMTVQGGLVKVN